MEAFALTQVLCKITTLKNIIWEDFRVGVEISWVYQSDDPAGPSSAYLRYQPGAKVPQHGHSGFEHIFMLEGSQTDDNGTYVAGDVVINPPGTHHSIISEDGCVVFAVWQAPVAFD
jgi:predicted ChrR family anti-sigma factor